MGLPPPTRGIRQQGLYPSETERSTPAHAGNTGESGYSTNLTRVYPRPRGEYEMLEPENEDWWGLPPPTRGILSVRSGSETIARSTPAHAGNTAADGFRRRQRGVYPRPRGEYG